jgi:hypothetical protein
MIVRGWTGGVRPVLMNHPDIEVMDLSLDLRPAVRRMVMMLVTVRIRGNANRRRRMVCGIALPRRKATCSKRQGQQQNQQLPDKTTHKVTVTDIH